jgi:hypothetical protein
LNLLSSAGWAAVAAMHWRDHSRLRYGKGMSSRQHQTLPRVFVSSRPTDRALRRALTKAAATHASADAAKAAEQLITSADNSATVSAK